MTPTGKTTPYFPRPIPESYWVIPGKFLAGEYPGLRYKAETRERLDQFLDAGFSTFIDLTTLYELPAYATTLLERAEALHLTVTHQRFGIGDMGLPTPDQMQAILNAIDAAIEQEHKVYLHCMAGVGRTGTTVGCYLVRHGMENEQALSQLATWWSAVPKSHLHPRSPETPAQIQFILQWPQGR